MRQRIVPSMLGFGLSLLVFAMLAVPVAAESDDNNDAYRMFWRIVAAVLLVGFIASVLFLLSTRWRKLINWPGHGE
ncbi:hypothetical protein BH09CHL1_BH09CHL1_17520 [soil metagenome]